jgi:N-methylhydantoinase A
VGALRSVLIERGLDPREFALCAFGGAGPLHASDLMQDTGIPRTIIPNNPGQFSAFGFIMTDARVDRHRTTQLTSKRFEPKQARDVMKLLVDEGIAELRDQGYTQDIEIFRSLEMRYLGQNYELDLPVASDALDDGGAERIWSMFHEAHRVRFGFNIPGEIIEIVNFSATIVARTAKPEFRRLKQADGPPPMVGRRTVHFHDQACDTPVFHREALAAGHVIEGPAIIEEAASVTVLNSGHRATVDDYGHLIIDIAGRA